MMRALRSVSSEKGRDPRDFALVAYGGSGPSTPRRSRPSSASAPSIVPPLAGLFSAVGLLFARAEFHDVRFCHLDADDVRARDARRARRRDARRPRAAIEGEPAEWRRDRRPPLRRAELGGRGRAARAARDDASGELDLAALRARFEDEHERLYGVRGSRARRSRSGRSGSPRSGRRAGRRPVDLRGGAGRPAVRHGAPVRRRRTARRDAGRARGSIGVAARARARCSSTSTTPRSSSRPAGRCAGTRRPRA